MPTLNQLVRKDRETSERKPKAPAFLRNFGSLHKKSIADNYSQKRSVYTAVKTVVSEKPNSALKKVAGAHLSNGVEVISCTSSEDHDLQKHSVMLIRDKRVKDLSDTRYHIVRGTLDAAGVANRQQARSRYDAKRSRTREQFYAAELSDHRLVSVRL